jgi:membrane-associated phospholipid phosphatase
MEKIALKKIIGEGNKAMIILFMAGVYLALYFISGAIYIGEAGYFMLTALDHAVPLMPWTSIIYLFIYPFLFIMCYEFEDDNNLNKTLYAYLILIVTSCIIFVIYPVAYPREFYPLSYENSITVNLLRGVRMVDKPVNCFPSLHVSSVFLFTFAFWHESKMKFTVFFKMSTLIALSTLTTKQHYVADVVAGFVLAFIIYKVVWSFTEIKGEIKRDTFES